MCQDNALTHILGELNNITGGFGLRVSLNEFE